MLGHDLDSYKKRFESFGWNAVTINGHSINSILSALKKARDSNKPFAIIAKTLKGKGVSFIENKNGWHGKPLDEKQLYKALGEIPNPKTPEIKIQKPKVVKSKKPKNQKLKLTKYKIGDEIATRTAYGNALANLAKANSEIVVVDAEVSNSTYSEKVKKVRPKQFIEAYIAEQNMVGMALGLSIKGFNVFASSFSAFFSRAHDQIRMSALSSPKRLTFCGSHAGVSIGEDGASQMGLEDISLFRSLPGSTVFYPSDAVSSEKLTVLASKLNGLKYIRTSRPKLPVLYKNSENFNIGDFKVLRQSPKDKTVIIGAGITVHEALRAYKELKKQKINVSVIDLYCIKPLNSKKLKDFIKKHGNKLIIIEDHYAEGGIGEMLFSHLSNSGIRIKHLAINDMPHSGKKEQLLEKYGIDWRALVKNVKKKW